jgi:hypothetical protein
MNRNLFLAVALVWASSAVAAQPASLCDVLQHRETYLGKRIVVRAVLTSFEHGAYLDAYPNCEMTDLHSVRIMPNQGLRWEEYQKAGGRKGIGVMVEAEGKLMWVYGVHQDTPPHLVFAISHTVFVEDAPCRTFQLQNDHGRGIVGCKKPGR